MNYKCHLKSILVKIVFVITIPLWASCGGVSGNSSSGSNPETEDQSIITPSEVTVTALSSESVQVNWSDNSNGEDHFTIRGYKNADCSGAFIEVTEEENAESAKILSLEKDTKWYFVVAAVNSADTSSEWTTPKSVTLDSSGEIELQVTWTKGSWSDGAKYIYTIWIENPTEDFYQNIFVSTKTNSRQLQGNMALQFWNCIKRGFFTQSEIDAVTSATNADVENVSRSEILFQGHTQFTVYIEVDHSFDENDYFTDQPPVVFKSKINLNDTTKNTYNLEFTGWSKTTLNQTSPFNSTEPVGTLFVEDNKDYILKTNTGGDDDNPASDMLISPTLTIIR